MKLVMVPTSLLYLMFIPLLTVSSPIPFLQRPSKIHFVNFVWVGILSGLTGAAGNLGGVVFAIIFRYNGTNYARAIWICGIMHIAMNVAVIWIRPIPKGQIGGR